MNRGLGDEHGAAMPTLEQSIGILRRCWDSFPARAEHFVPDLVLKGLSLDALENAEAVQTLVQTGRGARAFPSARATYEAAQQTLLLATAEEYDWEGSLAWVYFRWKDVRLRQDAGEGTVDLASDLDVTMRDWDDLAPGKSVVLRDASAAFLKKPPRRSNWLDVNLSDELTKRYERIGAQANMAEFVEKAERMQGVWKTNYGLLSRETHPFPRFQPSQVEVSDSGRLTFTWAPLYQKRRSEDAAEITRASVILAATGLLIRSAAVGGVAGK